MIPEENRERLGAAEGLLERLVSNLKRTEDVTLQKWTARALGNLSYEHGRRHLTLPEIALERRR